MVGNPVSGVILEYMDQIAGLWGWQWVFLLEGIPGCRIGIRNASLSHGSPGPGSVADTRRTNVAHAANGDGIATGRPPYRSYLGHGILEPAARLALDRRLLYRRRRGQLLRLFDSHFLKDRFKDWSPSEIGFLASLPAVVAIFGMNFIGGHSNRPGRRWHVACSAFLGAGGWVLVAWRSSGWLFVLGLAAALTGMKSVLPTFWAIPSTFLTGTAAASGLALINSVANLGGFFGPKMIGLLKSHSGSYTDGFLFVSAVLVAGGVLVLTVRITSRHGADE